MASEIFQTLGHWPFIFVQTTRLIGEEGLFPDELETIASARPSRRSEFSTGRWCAREALKSLGLPPSSIPKAHTGEPRWPLGAAGSISHTEGLICAVASNRYRSMGLDVQSRKENLDDSSWTHLIDSESLKNLAGLNLDPNLARLLIFSLREATFKCVFPVFGRPDNFHKIHLKRVEENGVVSLFVEIESSELTLPWVCLEGRFDWTAEHVLAVVWLRE